MKYKQTTAGILIPVDMSPDRLYGGFVSDNEEASYDAMLSQNSLSPETTEFMDMVYKARRERRLKKSQNF